MNEIICIKKYLCCGTLAVTSSPSILKYLLFFIKRCLVWQVIYGSKKYTKTNMMIGKTESIKVLILEADKKQTRQLMSKPQPNVFRINILSLVSNLLISRPSWRWNFNTLIILRNKYKLQMFFAVLAVMSHVNYSFASGNSCQESIKHYEQLYQIPKGLLMAISKVESDHNPLALGDGVNIYNLKTKDELLAKVNGLVAKAKTNFDVGCMQLNYYWHHHNFSSLEEMIDVKSNVRYASGFLFSLYKESGSWNEAVKNYHSKDPNFNRKYSRKVILAWIGDKSL